MWRNGSQRSSRRRCCATRRAGEACGSSPARCRRCGGCSRPGSPTRHLPDRRPVGAHRRRAAPRRGRRAAVRRGREQQHPLRLRGSARPDRGSARCSARDVRSTGVRSCSRSAACRRSASPTRAFLDAGDTIAVEAPTWGAALSAARERGRRGHCDPDGRRRHGRRRAGAGDRTPGRRRHARSSSCTRSRRSTRRRAGACRARAGEQLLGLAERHGFLVLEDNVYGELRYDGDEIPTLFSLDRSGLVVKIDSFSKILAPGAAHGLGHGRSRGDPRARRGAGRSRREPVDRAGRRPLHGRGEARATHRVGEHALPREARCRRRGVARALRSVGELRRPGGRLLHLGRSSHPRSTASRR